MATAQQSASSEESSCQFCENQMKYTCPRCNAPYCSRDCYNCQAHAVCSEGFYKDMIESELKSGTASNESKQKMMEILQRIDKEETIPGINDLDSDDDEDEQELADRIKDIDLDDSDALWSRLTKSEQEEFEKIVKSGDVSQLMPSWIPWWRGEYHKPLVRGIDEDDVPSYINICPKIVKVLPLSHITKVKPAACVSMNILNVLAAYCWTVRLFNGDHEDSCLDATEALLTLSPVLSSGANYEEAVIATDTVKVIAENFPWLTEDEEFMSTIRSDVRCLIEGPTELDRTFFIKSALSDILFLLKSAKSLLAKRKTSRSKNSLFTSSLVGAHQNVELKLTTSPLIKSIIKKVEYFLSFTMESNVNPY